MSVKVIAAVWSHSQSQLAARLVLLAIADNAEDGSGIAFPPVLDHPDTPPHKLRSISFKARLSEREVRRSLRELEELGELETRKAQRGRSRINVYRVTVGYLLERDPQIEDLPFQLLEPFTTTGQIVRQSEARPPAIQSLDHRPSTPATTGQPYRARGDKPDHHFKPSETEDSSENEESSVPAEAGEQADDRESLRWALTAELGAKRLTRNERGAWELAISDLLEVDATIAQVAARCAAYRELWPSMVMTPLALTRHWNLLGARVELQTIAPTVDLERWLTNVCQLDSADLRVLLEERGVEPGEIESQLERAAELRAEQDAGEAAARQAIEEAA